MPVLGLIPIIGQPSSFLQRPQKVSRRNQCIQRRSFKTQLIGRGQQRFQVNIQTGQRAAVDVLLLRQPIGPTEQVCSLDLKIEVDERLSGVFKYCYMSSSLSLRAP